MRRRFATALATTALAATAVAAAATPALAGSPYEDGERAGTSRDARAAPPARRGPAGLFSCSFRERRTKLERKNCGTIRS